MCKIHLVIQLEIFSLKGKKKILPGTSIQELSTKKEMATEHVWKDRGDHLLYCLWPYHRFVVYSGIITIKQTKKMLTPWKSKLGEKQPRAPPTHPGGLGYWQVPRWSGDNRLLPAAGGTNGDTEGDFRLLLSYKDTVWQRIGNVAMLSKPRGVKGILKKKKKPF